LSICLILPSLCWAEGISQIRELGSTTDGHRCSRMDFGERVFSRYSKVYRGDRIDLFIESEARGFAVFFGIHGEVLRPEGEYRRFIA
jgi:hypothetical protein